MSLIPCPECKREISDAALSCPHCGAPRSWSPGIVAMPGGPAMLFVRRGFEYRSSLTFCGLPLFHFATGFDPQTGKKRIAKGIIAIGDIALGVLALGGFASGGLTFGGVSIGLLSFGGLAIAAVAIGGLALGVLLALGGGAVGYAAIGGAAFGYYAMGGASVGVHVINAISQDPDARAFFGQFLGADFLRQIQFH